jgi:hypothetical protein
MTSTTRPITAGGTDRAGRTPVSVRLVGGPTELIDVDALRPLTDPAIGTPEAAERLGQGATPLPNWFS